MNKKILSLCLPTYKRSRCIGEQLKRLSTLDASIFEQIEVIVSDNCSPDDTQQVIESYIGRFPFTYIRNSENIGPDANFLQCMQKANGQYIWLLGDDDYILTEKLPVLLDDLNKGDYGLVHIKSNPKIAVNEEFTNIEDFLEDVGIFITFMSGNIINQRFFNKIDLTEYIGSYFLQVPAYLISAISSKTNKMIRFQMFEAGAAGNANGGYNLFQVFVANYLKIFRDFLNKGLITGRLYKKEVKVSQNFVMNYAFKFFVLRSKHNFKTDNAWKILFEHFGRVRFICAFVKYSIYNLCRKICGKLLRIMKINK